MKLTELMLRCAAIQFAGIEAYCEWAEDRAETQADLNVLALLPLALLALILWAMPAFISVTVAFTLTVPILYLGAVALFQLCRYGRL